MDASNTGRLVKLDEIDQTVADSDEDIRGRKVFDVNGEEIGKVNDLLVDAQEHKVRFLEVASGGFLGIGKDTTFIPVDAIVNITEDDVILDQTRERVAGAPVYDPDVVRERDSHGGLLDYYGFAPYWGPGYVYPAYPHYGHLR